jgi:hypothetical protein
MLVFKRLQKKLNNAQYSLSSKKIFLDETGAVAIIGTLVFFLVLLPLFGLATEASYWLTKQRKLQHIADMTAYAGAVECRSRKTAQVIRSAMQIIVDASNDSGSLRIDPELITELPDCKVSGARRISVTLKISVGRYVSKIIPGLPPQQVITARAAVQIKSPPDGSSSACMLALAPNGANALKLPSAAATLNALGCDVIVNSNDENAVTLNTVTANCVYTAGGGSISNTDNIACEKKLVTNSHPVADPYANFVLPTMEDTACNFNSSIVPSSNIKVMGQKTQLEGSAHGQPSIQISPSAPCNYIIFNENIEFQGGWNFGPGTYIFKGGYAVNPSNDAAKKARLSGQDVTFIFNTENIQASNNNYYDLSAPKNGPLAGLLFYQKNPTNSTQEINFGAQGTSVLNGALYFPTANFKLGGGAEAYIPQDDRCTQIIAYRIEILGSSSLQANSETCKNNGGDISGPIYGNETLAFDPNISDF